MRRKWRSHFDGHRRQKPIFAGKSDLKSAFRILVLSRNSWKWLVMKARDPETDEWRFFIDKCLPFGSSISCLHFQRFSDVLHHIIQFRLNEKKRITNYLDDFLFITRTLCRCNFMIQQFLDLCRDLGVPVSMEKTEWASELVIFLGICLNGSDLTMNIPLETRDRAIEMLIEIINKKKVTVKQLQQLCGYLNFLSKAIVLGRTFT